MLTVQQRTHIVRLRKNRVHSKHVEHQVNPLGSVVFFSLISIGFWVLDCCWLLRNVPFEIGCTVWNNYLCLTRAIVSQGKLWNMLPKNFISPKKFWWYPRTTRFVPIIYYTHIAYSSTCSFNGYLFLQTYNTIVLQIKHFKVSYNVFVREVIWSMEIDRQYVSRLALLELTLCKLYTKPLHQLFYQFIVKLTNKLRNFN